MSAMSTQELVVQLLYFTASVLFILGLKGLGNAESARRGLALGDGVIGYLLTRARRDMAFLEALVAHLDRHALEHQRRVTIPLVRDALGSLDHDPPRPV